MLGWQTVGYVEFDKFCQKVLAQRIKDGFLQEAPIFGDVDDFIQSGAAKRYAGFIDVVTAGFPCQPFSVAGKRRLDDPRNKWPQTLAVICDLRPRFAFLENVPGLLTSGYFEEILSSLAESGFDVRWDCISAAAVGAPHRRNRLWILAESQHSDTHSIRSHRAQKHQHGSSEPEHEQVSQSGSVCEVLADADSDDGWTGSGTVPQGGGSRVEYRGGSAGQSVGPSGEDVADAESARLQTRGGDRVGTDHGSRRNKGQSEGACGETGDVADSESKQRNGGGRKHHSGERSGQGEIGGASGSTRGSQGWWPTEPQLGRVADGVANRVDRLKAIGNGQVSRVVATAWALLTQ